MKGMQQFSEQGTNATKIGQYNARTILTHLRRMKEASKKELAVAAGMTPQALTVIVDKLAEAGLVQKTRRRMGGVGQPSLMYEINPTGAYSIGIKLSRRGMDLLSINFMGEVKSEIQHEVDFHHPSSGRSNGPHASAIGGAVLPLYSHFAPDRFVLTHRALT